MPMNERHFGRSCFPCLSKQVGNVNLVRVISVKVYLQISHDFQLSRSNAGPIYVET